MQIFIANSTEDSRYFAIQEFNNRVDQIISQPKNRIPNDLTIFLFNQISEDNSRYFAVQEFNNRVDQIISQHTNGIPNDLTIPIYNQISDRCEVKKIINLPNIDPAFFSTISDLELKVNILIEVIKNGDWHNPLLDQELENAEFRNACKNWIYETPWVGLHALKNGKISEEDFFIMQQYFCLRHQFPKDQIEVVKPNDPSKRWEKLLQAALVKRKKEEYPSNTCVLPSLKPHKFKIFTENVRESFASDIGRGVLFCVYPPKKIGTTLISGVTLETEEGVWQATRTGGFHLFSNDVDANKHIGILAPLAFYQEVLKLLFPKSYVDLVVNFDLSNVDEQFDRCKEGRGVCQVLLPFPTKFTPTTFQHAADTLIDYRVAFGADAIMHDLYHALLVSFVPNKIRSKFYDYVKELVQNEDFRNSNFNNFHELKQLDKTQRLQAAEYFKERIYDMENIPMRALYILRHNIDVVLPRDPLDRSPPGLCIESLDVALSNIQTKKLFLMAIDYEIAIEKEQLMKELYSGLKSYLTRAFYQQ